jgi:hypothetical protein
MEVYKNYNGDSGVESFEIGPDYIKVKFFKTGQIYTYSYFSASMPHVEEAKLRARNGKGLNSYINKYIKKLYEK